MPSLPACTALGADCRSLRVTLRIGSLEEGEASLDHEATWLLGHTQHITFGDPWNDGEDLYVEAVLHVPCKHLAREGPGARCRAHGFTGDMPRQRATREQPRRLGLRSFRVVDHQRLVRRDLDQPRRALPVLQEDNPCQDAPCRTADNTRGSACCRDLQVEIMCTRKEVLLERLVFARKSPYLCKVSREGDFSIEAEMISACGYLDEEGACSLHGRTRADGRPAKPDLCSDWPPKGKGLHPGCVFAGRRRRAASTGCATGSVAGVN